MADDHEDIGKTITGTADPAALQLFDDNLVTNLKGVRVFDIGQGDCIGLRNQDDEVFCYVDYGGLDDHPDKTNPAATAHRMPVRLGGKYVSIVITHWDKDHYWSANKKNPDAQNCEWLVPRQTVSPQAVLLARKLKNAKCWPESRGDRPASFGVGADHDIVIRKCRPHDASAIKEDRNLSGLAVSLQQWNDTNVEMAMLLPGDCPFDRIPHPPMAPLRAVVAYHHGSHTHWTNATTTAVGNRHPTYDMVYSFGKNNHGHPDRSSYEPDWNSNSVETPDVRANGDQSTDMSW